LTRPRIDEFKGSAVIVAFVDYGEVMRVTMGELDALPEGITGIESLAAFR
jgi:hypothetical protein